MLDRESGDVDAEGIDAPRPQGLDEKPERASRVENASGTNVDRDPIRDSAEKREPLGVPPIGPSTGTRVIARVVRAAIDETACAVRISLLAPRGSRAV